MCFLFFVCVCFLKRERKNIRTKLGESEGGEDLGWGGIGRGETQLKHMV